MAALPSARLISFLLSEVLSPWNGRVARIPVYKGWIPVQKRIGRGDVYLVGDAAAQVKVSTVGGIVTGFRGARAVVDSILQNSNKELRVLRRELGTHWLIRRALHHFRARRLLATRGHAQSLRARVLGFH